MADKKIEYTIVDEIGVLSISEKGWRKELNLVSWNGRDPKYDIRDWAPDHEKMGKGITLSKNELKKLKDVLSQIDESYSYESVTLDELVNHWSVYIRRSPETIRNHLSGSYLNELNSDTVIIYLQKGAYSKLSSQNNMEKLSRFVEELIGKQINVEIMET